MKLRGGIVASRYVNVSLTPEAYQLLKQLKEDLGLRSYSDVIFYLHKGYESNCIPKFKHEELNAICKLLDDNWDSVGELVARLLGRKRARLANM